MLKAASWFTPILDRRYHLLTMRTETDSTDSDNQEGAGHVMLLFFTTGVTAWCEEAHNTQSTTAIEFKPYIAIIDYSWLGSGIEVTRQIRSQLPKRARRLSGTPVQATAVLG